MGTPLTLASQVNLAIVPILGRALKTMHQQAPKSPSLGACACWVRLYLMLCVYGTTCHSGKQLYLMFQNVTVELKDRPQMTSVVHPVRLPHRVTLHFQVQTDAGGG